MTRTTIATALIGSLTLAACGDMALTPTNAGLNQAREMYPNMSATEFSILDTDGNGFLSEQERAAIGEEGIDSIEVDDQM